MKFLWLLTSVPYPPDTGGKQDSFYLLREFSRLGDDIYCGIIYHGDDPPEVPAEFSELVKKVYFLRGNPDKLHSQLFSSLGDDVPFKFRKYWSDEAVSSLTSILESETDFDVVLIDHLHLAPLILDTRANLIKSDVRVPKTVLRTPNVESTIVRKYSERVDNVLVKTFAKREARKMKKYESSVLAEFDLVAAISPVDTNVLEKMAGGRAHVITVTAGVDLDSLTPPESEPIEGEVVFVGSFDWHPNVEGAIWFVDHIWPKVLDKAPGAHLSLVGRKPPEPMQRLASDSVEITGSVESIAEYVERASCSIVPLNIGSGMRLKILEAFALGCAVVSTSLGAEGIAYTNEKDILIADKPAAFADAVVKVLQDSELRDMLGRNGRLLAEKKYAWSGVAKGFREEIVRLF